MCPFCLCKIDPIEEAGSCALCGEILDQEESESILDVKKEVRSIEAKLKELNSYIDDVNNNLTVLRVESVSKLNELKKLNYQLDKATERIVSPYTNERDSIIEIIAECNNQLENIVKQKKWYDGINNRVVKVGNIDRAIDEKSQALKREEAKKLDKDEIFYMLVQKFGDILREIGFPKLYDPTVNSDLVPCVRGLSYREVGSDGAITLLSFAWFWAIYELSNEIDSRHPGFVMIDSPQKNIGSDASDLEFRNTQLATNIYKRMIRKLNEYGDKCTMHNSRQ